ncbi:DoxX family protein [Sagittula stellata]|uniref:DoxX family protein n=1 Tax=Sagittula stellata TaxID=52603 RepID=UPI0002DFEED1|nr:DoxX family protein [Sagittula stellata]
MPLLNRFTTAHAGLSRRLDRLSGPLIPLLLRAVFAATLLGYFWKSAGTKVFDRQGAEGIFDVLTLESGVYAQMFPKQFEAAGYDPSKLSVLHDLIAYAGTLAEFILPLLIVVGLLTRLSALGMIGFVIVQTATDVLGHGADPGRLFDARYDLIDERTLWIMLFALLVLRGAGDLSLDRLSGLEAPQAAHPTGYPA